MKNPVRAVAVMLAAALALAAVAAPTPAFAHAGLVESDPAQGAELDQAPKEVTLSFNEDISQPAYVVVTAAGERVEQGAPRVDGGTVTQRVAADAGSGPWTMAYRVVSSDGHPVTGEVAFTVAAADPAEQPGAEITPESPDWSMGPDEEASSEDVEGDQAAQAGQVGDTEEAGLWARHGEHVVVGAVLLALAAGILVLVRRRAA